jgi:hypothetical protein
VITSERDRSAEIREAGTEAWLKNADGGAF